MPQHEATMTQNALKIFEQPTLTPFVQECLSDPDKNIRAGLFCAFVTYSVNRGDMQSALQSSFTQQKSLFHKDAFSMVQARELAMAQHGGKIENKKCPTCQTLFLTETGSKSKTHCFEHHQVH